MSDYRVSSAGHDVALGSLTVLSPQPRSRGVQATRRSYAADGSVHDAGLYVELVWDLLQDATDYQAILSAFGVSGSTKTNAVTVYVRDQTFSYTRYNGTAVQPQVGQDVDWQNSFPRAITLLVKGLEAAA